MVFIDARLCPERRLTGSAGSSERSTCETSVHPQTPPRGEESVQVLLLSSFRSFCGDVNIHGRRKQGAWKSNSRCGCCTSLHRRITVRTNNQTRGEVTLTPDWTILLLLLPPQRGAIKHSSLQARRRRATAESMRRKCSLLFPVVFFKLSRKKKKLGLFLHKMLKCCISSCGKDRSSCSKLKFFPIPSGHQVDRSRLWRQAIQRANGETGELKGSAHVCGNHFLSGTASEDPHSPDFVPSVFASPEIINQKKRGRKRRIGCFRADVRQEEIQTPPPAKILTEDKSPVLMETETQPSSSEEAETLTHLPEAEPGATENHTESLCPNQTSLSIIKSKIIADMNKVRPVVLLKRVVIPQESFLCDLCNENFTNESEFNKHQQLHEESAELSDETGAVQHQDAGTDELSFPCNICGRSYASTHLLKRHKLLHVRDNRKCSTCGVMFCRRHNHTIFNPTVADVVPKTEEDSSASEPEIEERTVEDVQPEVSEQSQTDDFKERVLIVTPIQIITVPSTQRPVCPPKTVQLRPLMPKVEKEPKEQKQPQTVAPSPSSPAPFSQPTEFPGFLKMFSPQYLTSALLDVQRNYQYIFSKSKHAETSRQNVKPRQSVQDGKELIAYDIEIEI